MHTFFLNEYVSWLKHRLNYIMMTMDDSFLVFAMIVYWWRLEYLCLLVCMYQYWLVYNRIFFNIIKNIINSLKQISTILWIFCFISYGIYKGWCKIHPSNLKNKHKICQRSKKLQPCNYLLYFIHHDWNLEYAICESCKFWLSIG